MVSAAVLPLLVAGQAVGVVCLFTGSRRALTPGETKVMEAFAEHAAVALTKARLFQDIQDRRRVSEELYTLTVSMMRSMDLRQRVDTFVHGAQEALRFDRISVLLPDSDGTALEVAASTEEEAAARLAVPIAGGGAIERAWQSGETALILSDADLAALPPLDPELQEHPLLRATRFAAVPLRFQELTIGVVLADNTRSRRERHQARRGAARAVLPAAPEPRVQRGPLGRDPAARARRDPPRGGDAAAILHARPRAGARHHHRERALRGGARRGRLLPMGHPARRARPGPRPQPARDHDA